MHHMLFRIAQKEKRKACQKALSLNNLIKLNKRRMMTIKRSNFI